MVPEDGVFLFGNHYLLSAKLLWSLEICYVFPMDKESTNLWDQNFVTSFYTQWHTLALFVQSTRSNSEHLGLIEFLDTAFWKEDAASCPWCCLDALDKHAIEKGHERLDGFDGERLGIS
jgi:hypothetical protein